MKAAIYARVSTVAAARRLLAASRGRARQQGFQSSEPGGEVPHLLLELGDCDVVRDANKAARAYLSFATAESASNRASRVRRSAFIACWSCNCCCN